MLLATWRDNVFVERIWRSVKCEDVYLHTHAQSVVIRRETCTECKANASNFPALLPFSGARSICLMAR